MPPCMSTGFPPFCGSAAAVLGLQLLISQCVDHGNALAVVIQCPPDFLNIAVLFHQFHGINLAETVRGYVLRQSERLSRPLDILPNCLPGVMLPWIPTRENPVFPGILSQVRQKRLR